MSSSRLAIYQGHLTDGQLTLPPFRLKCDEAPEEATTVLTEKISKLDCNISVTTNYLYNGIMDVSILHPVSIPR